MNELNYLEAVKTASKARSMVYQAEAKEALAIKHDKPINAYYYINYYDWIELFKNNA